MIWLFIVGLFTAVLVYPALHELGHSLATLMFGGKVIEFHLLPLPNMLCDGSSVGNAGLVTIGLCGMLIPFLISISFKPKHFTLWYVMQLIKGISSLAFALSLMSLCGRRFGFRIANDDIITALNFWPDGNTFFIITITVFLLLAIYSICRQQPIKRLYRYFEINEK